MIEGGLAVRLLEALVAQRIGTAILTLHLVLKVVQHSLTIHTGIRFGADRLLIARQFGKTLVIAADPNEVNKLVSAFALANEAIAYRHVRSL